MLSLRGRACLVVGGGGVALRKVGTLLAERAHVTVVASAPLERLRQLAADGRIHLEERPYSAGEAARYRLVFAATDDRAVNHLVYADAEAAGVWANVADDPEACSFHVPARVQRGSLQLTVSSAGDAPFVVRRLRQTLARRLGHEWGEWIEAAARFRARVRALDRDPVAEQALYDRFFAETVDAGRLTARVPGDAEVESWLGSAAASPPAAAPAAATAVARRGLVSLVGAGPGDPGLLTVRGRARLLAADVIVYDRLAEAALPPDLPEGTELHCVGKTAGHHPTPQGEINALLVRLAGEGKRVVRLKGGDPFVFGRGGEEAEDLQAAGIPWEVVPGVTAGVAVPAYAGIPVTHRREAVRVTLLTAHECSKSDGPQVRWDLLAADPHGTIAGYMGVTSLPSVVANLLAAGMDPQTPAAVIERGTLPCQRQVTSTLHELPGAVANAGLEPPALFVIGPTVAYAGRLDWRAHLPLVGERVLVPGADPDLAARLEEAGAAVVQASVPLSPAARVALAASPLTGVILSDVAEVDLIEGERGDAGWDDAVVAWCRGSATGARARALGWGSVREVGDDIAELVAAMARRDRAPACA